jgi:hypothetical protein
LRRALETLSLTDIAANLMTCTEQGPFHLETWGQVFSNSITFSQPTPEFISSRAQLITLWGNGRINIRRASDLVIEAACRDIIGENKTELLLELRRKNPESNLKSLLEKAALDSAQLSRLEDLLSDSSNCYSLWLTVTSSRTSETEFIVLDENGEAISRIYW